MSQIDPRLGATYGCLPPPSLPRPSSQQSPYGPGRTDSLRSEPGAAYTNSAQPYYQFPTPPQHPSASSTANASNQPSPTQNAYRLSAGSTGPGAPAVLDNEASPDDVAGDGDGDGDPGSNDPKRQRACESCRGLKVRCIQDPTRSDLPCQRCAKAGRQCVVTQPTRKRQKKADSRVAELEKKIDALSAALQQQHHHLGPTTYGMPGPAAPGPTLPGDAFAPRGGVSTQTSNYGTGEARAAPMDAEVPVSKRQRTDEGHLHTAPHEKASTSQPNSGRTSVNPEDAVARKFDDIRVAWAPTGNAKQYLSHTTPEQFTDRINSLISPEQAAVLFKRFTDEITPHLPAIVFPPSTTAADVFREKPILYVCILSAAAFGTIDPDITRELVREAVGSIADCVVINGAKSLELIQAMQVVALYYKPPERSEQTNFYQIIHMAAVMALDIGLGKRFKPAKARRGFGGPNAHFAPGPGLREPQDSDTLEARRAWLTCYYLCATASMVLRRPNLVRWTNYMRESLDVLESHPDAFESDKLFCQHVKIQRICEDIGLQFLMDDYTANISITDSKVIYALSVLENQLKKWKEDLPEQYKNDRGLRFFEHVCSLYLHEIALHLNHNVEDFKLPFTEESLKSVNNTSDTPLTPNQIAALDACLKAAHGILDTMLSYPIEKMRTLPMFLFFVRCIYAIVILIKMHVAVCTPGSEMGKIMKPQDLKVDWYMGQLIGMFERAAQPGSALSGSGMDERDDGGLRRSFAGSAGQPKVLRILGLLKEWYEQHKKNALAENGHMRETNGTSGSKLPTASKHHRSRVVAGADEPAQPATLPPPPPPQQQQQQQQQLEQTPLHLLSQVATGDQQPPPQPNSTPNTISGPPTEWTFPTPNIIDYHRRPSAKRSDSNNVGRWNQHPANSPRPTELNPSYVDPNLAASDHMGLSGDMPLLNQEYPWSGFEQAMDIALGGVDALQGDALDPWFMGGGMAPFVFNGEGAGGVGMSQWG